MHVYCEVVACLCGTSYRHNNDHTNALKTFTGNELLSVRVLLIGILVHLISLLMSNEELCICFALLNNHSCYYYPGTQLYLHFVGAVLVVGDLIIWLLKIEGSLLNI
jgi:hypothetical protein